MKIGLGQSWVFLTGVGMGMALGWLIGCALLQNPVGTVTFGMQHKNEIGNVTFIADDGRQLAIALGDKGFEIGTNPVRDRLTNRIFSSKWWRVGPEGIVPIEYEQEQ